MDLLFCHQRRYTPANLERWIRRQRMGYCHPATVLQDRIDLHFASGNVVCDEVQRHE